MNLKLTTILTYADIGTISSCLAVNDAMATIDKETENMLGAYGSQLNGLF